MWAAESRLFKTILAEKQIGSNYREVWKFGGQITVLDWWGEVGFGWNYLEFRNPRVREIPILSVWLCLKFKGRTRVDLRLPFGWIVNNNNNRKTLLYKKERWTDL